MATKTDSSKCLHPFEKLLFTHAKHGLIDKIGCLKCNVWLHNSFVNQTPKEYLKRD